MRVPILTRRETRFFIISMRLTRLAIGPDKSD
jgi:hypothetical protein